MLDRGARSGNLIPFQEQWIGYNGPSGWKMSNKIDIVVRKGVVRMRLLMAKMPVLMRAELFLTRRNLLETGRRLELKGDVFKLKF